MQYFDKSLNFGVSAKLYADNLFCKEHKIEDNNCSWFWVHVQTGQKLIIELTIEPHGFSEPVYVDLIVDGIFRRSVLARRSSEPQRFLIDHVWIRHTIIRQAAMYARDLAHLRANKPVAAKVSKAPPWGTIQLQFFVQRPSLPTISHHRRGRAYTNDMTRTLAPPVQKTSYLQPTHYVELKPLAITEDSEIGEVQTNAKQALMAKRPGQEGPWIVLRFKYADFRIAAPDLLELDPAPQSDPRRRRLLAAQTQAPGVIANSKDSSEDVWTPMRISTTYRTRRQSSARDDRKRFVVKANNSISTAASSPRSPEPRLIAAGRHADGRPSNSSTPNPSVAILDDTDQAHFNVAKQPLDAAKSAHPHNATSNDLNADVEPAKDVLEARQHKKVEEARLRAEERRKLVETERENAIWKREQAEECPEKRVKRGRTLPDPKLEGHDALHANERAEPGGCSSNTPLPLRQFAEKLDLGP